MMKILVLLAIAVFKMADAGVEILPKEQAPDNVPYEPGCWSSDLNQYVVGTVDPINAGCLRYTCGSDGNIRRYSCPTYSGNCDPVKGNPNAGYPDCCDSIKCGEGQIGTGVA